MFRHPPSRHSPRSLGVNRRGLFFTSSRNRKGTRSPATATAPAAAGGRERLCYAMISSVKAVHVGLVVALDAAALQGVCQGHFYYTIDIQLGQCSRFRLCRVPSSCARLVSSVLLLSSSQAGPGSKSGAWRPGPPGESGRDRAARSPRAGTCVLPTWVVQAEVFFARGPLVYKRGAPEPRNRLLNPRLVPACRIR